MKGFMPCVIKSAMWVKCVHFRDQENKLSETESVEQVIGQWLIALKTAFWGHLLENECKCNGDITEMTGISFKSIIHEEYNCGTLY